VAAEFHAVSGRQYGLFEAYRLEDADVGIVILNSAAGTAKDAVDEARTRGIKVGLLKPRLFRPFPYAQIAGALKHLKAVCVLDRVDSFGAYGPLYAEIAAGLYSFDQRPRLINRIYGLGGRDFLPRDAQEVIEETAGIAAGKTGADPVKEYISIRN
jgi:pyruvate ferredoxin oxidoreductase alpha subunit